MNGDRQEYSLAELGAAFGVINERIMLPHSMDLIFEALGDRECEARRIEINWDQSAECTITCRHGRWKARSDFLHLTEAFMRAAQMYRNGDHTPFCGRIYVDRIPMPNGEVEPLEIDCTLLRGHEGECGGD